jgi:hypothetical protein
MREYAHSKRCEVFADRIDIQETFGFVSSRSTIESSVDLNELRAQIAEAAAAPTTSRPAPTDMNFTSYSVITASGEEVFLSAYTQAEFIDRDSTAGNALKAALDAFCD